MVEQEIRIQEDVTTAQAAAQEAVQAQSWINVQVRRLVTPRGRSGREQVGGEWEGRVIAHSSLVR